VPPRLLAPPTEKLAFDVVATVLLLSYDTKPLGLAAKGITGQLGSGVRNRCSTMEPPRRQHCILITNLQHVILGGLRAHCSALLLENYYDGGRELYKVRGFGPHSCWPVFDYFLHAGELDFEITPGSKLGFWPSGCVMAFKNGPELTLHARDDSRPLCRDEFRAGDPVSGSEEDKHLYSKIWKRLRQRAVEFTPDNNAIPVLRHVPKPLLNREEDLRRA
jgi:hypothetical protein